MTEPSEQSRKLHFLEPEELSQVLELSSVSCKQTPDPKKAFGFIRTNALPGDLYVTPKRLFFLKHTVPEPALDLPLARIDSIESPPNSVWHLHVHFHDEVGREKTWHFTLGVDPLVEKSRELHAWRQRAQEYLARAKGR